METQPSSDKSRIWIGIVIGITLLALTAGTYSLAFFMVSILVIGCTHSLPDWLYMIVFIGFPLPMIISSIVVPYLYIKRQKAVWIFLAIVLGIFLSCVIFLIWFIILTQHC